MIYTELNEEGAEPEDALNSLWSRVIQYDGRNRMIEYLVKPTQSEWFEFPKDSKPYRTMRTPYKEVQGWGNGRIEVDGCVISFSDEDPGIQVSFEGSISQERADTLIKEIREAISDAAGEPGEIVQISW